jgi:hypothetical protein
MDWLVRHRENLGVHLGNVEGLATALVLGRRIEMTRVPGRVR